jgi:murein L,D-transpeptidase YcbB/YkuD
MVGQQLEQIKRSFFIKLGFLCVIFFIFFTQSLRAELTDFAFKLGLLEKVAGEKAVEDFYQNRNFRPVWIGQGPAATERRTALFTALEQADLHALPTRRYRADLRLFKKRGQDGRQLGILEGQLTMAFLRYAKDVHAGLLNPSKVDELIFRKLPRINPSELLQRVVSEPAKAVFNSLPPQSDAYKNLMKARQKLFKARLNAPWGPVLLDERLAKGAEGDRVVQLRNRLISQGYLKHTASARFDGDLRLALQRFQKDHGLSPDGIAGSNTIAELNVPISQRLQSIEVAMERERWINHPQQNRQIVVNLTDYTVKLIENGTVKFQTRSVVGADIDDQRSPEFSDVMEYMVINPTWNVPKSITLNEYLPELQEDPSAHSYLTLYDQDGQVVDRDFVDFLAYDQDSFPYDLKQLPSQTNALGLVKFMLPNPYNIYLHDTPSKALFAKETRAFSHGCIRLHQPFDFAFELLSDQSYDPVGDFFRLLDAGKEASIILKNPVPVHIIYRTAVAEYDGRIGFRRDIYGRDARIFESLRMAGLALEATQG